MSGISYRMPALIFGVGAIDRLAVAAEGSGKRAALFYSGSFGRSGGLDCLIDSLSGAGIASFPKKLSLGDEPTPDTVDDAVLFIRECGADTVISVGGGSVIDVGKIAAGVAVNGGLTHEYVENIGDRSFTLRPLPFFAAPTTSGTGSEMAKNGVVYIKGQFKNSIRSDRLFARAAVVDPALTLTLPPAVTASSGADALCQLIESYTTKPCTPFTDAIALKHIAGMDDALVRAVRDGEDIDARTTLSLGATMSGICIANSGLGLAHGISASLGAVKGIKHGIGCGILMPHVARFNAKKGVTKYIDVAAQLGGSYTDAIAAGEYVAETITRLNDDIDIPSDLKSYKLLPDELDQVISLTAVSSSARKNPVPVSADELRELLLPLV